MEVERWLPVVGYEGRYEVSNFGQCRSLVYGSRYGTFERALPKLLTPQPNSAKSGGHMRVKLSLDGSGAYALLHILVLEAFVVPRPPGMEGLHNNGDVENCRLDNLRWGTHAENMAEMADHGRSQRGEKCHTAVISEEQAREAKRLLATGMRRKAVSQQLNISFGIIENIARGRAWAWIDE